MDICTLGVIGITSEATLACIRHSCKNIIVKRVITGGMIVIMVVTSLSLVNELLSLYTVFSAYLSL